MPNIRALKERIGSVDNIRQITRAMEMVATTKLRRFQSRAESSSPYAAQVRALTARLAGDRSAREGRPLFHPGRGEGRAILLITSDRGLCGAYNSTVLREAENFVETNGGRDAVDVFAVGRRAREYMRKRDYRVFDERTDLGGDVDSSLANEIGNILIDRFRRGEAARVVLLFNRFVSAVKYVPKATQFLPLEAEKVGAVQRDEIFHTEIDYIMEPDAAAVFEALLPRYIRTRLFAALLEALTSEHNARRLAMNSATENCEDMIDSLTLRMNKARQAAITKEILDIVGGAEALRG